MYVFLLLIRVPPPFVFVSSPDFDGTVDYVAGENKIKQIIFTKQFKKELSTSSSSPSSSSLPQDTAAATGNFFVFCFVNLSNNQSAL